ncbi:MULTISPECIES: LD-carboxypeptidase [unclassified Olleya]|jgi:muramoyltetrapeptide carboxypeptidase|uniref:S66 peptidase family protein n=1 Tax=unclassified Olleya TaxID=2615019 RepID=UPI0011A232A1|nr:LD-carboxypeptidase [Olleya sp. Hel_I_94]|tara:strand:- start:214254 stop:215261 length:1008 start_codon:yes stop_codon:yes gene_type:complete
MSKKRLLLLVCCAVFFLGNTTGFAQNKTETKLIQPPYLKAGDTVAIVAPSGVLKNRFDEVNRAKQLLESWKLHVVIGKHVFNQANHFAGTDQERCEDFQMALDDPKIKAIWSARGGYGTVRILDSLDYTKFLKQPKWIIGYSDITALHNQIHNLGVQSLHAIMGVSLPENLEDIADSIATFKNTLFGQPLRYALKGSKYNKSGDANGILVGGNLTILHTMLGSKDSIDTDGKILFIEEIGEYKYHIDRMLQSLKRAGYFDNCKGVIVGDMSRMRKNTTLWGTSIEQLILDALSDYNFPIAFNMPAGHEKDNRALILGRQVVLKVDKSKSTLIFEE